MGTKWIIVFEPIFLPMANFGPLLGDSLTHQTLITAFLSILELKLTT